MISQYAKLRLEAPKRAALLDDLVQRVAEHARDASPAVVFDLDGTLMDNRPRVVAILQELAKHWRDAHPESAERLAKVTSETMAYKLADTFDTLGIGEPELLEEAQHYWHERFFVDGYLKHDIEVPGAVAFARRLYDAGANLIYLTGRDLPNMAVGTFASLRDLGFPIGVVGTELVTKPVFEIPDSEFKLGVAHALQRVGKIVAAFDNEPANCNILLDVYPGCESVLLDTAHAPDPPQLADGVLVIDTFEV